jgi:hypothetical protein
VGKHSAPKAPMPSAQAIVTTALGVPAVIVTSLTGSAVASEAQTTTTSDPSAVPANARFLPPTDEELTRLRYCEASGRYETNTGNGFYGAYQFDAQTWRGLGLPGLPHQAPPNTQDRAATVLEQQRGWQPWPSCSRRLSLVPRRNHGLTVQQVLGVTEQASAHTVARAATPFHAQAAPSFTRVLSLASAQTYRSDVRLWQERMQQRGWPITVDGFFGAQSAAVARAFATEKGIHEGLGGEVGAHTWAGAWKLPVR